MSDAPIRPRPPVLIAALLLVLSGLQDFGAVAAYGADAAEPAGGRLFFTPERREQLERQRRSQRDTETVIEDDSLSVDGIVTRSSGKWTVWINGRPVDEGERAPVPARPLPGKAGEASVRLGDDERHGTALAVGDRIDRASGERSPLLGNGRVRVGSRPLPR